MEPDLARIAFVTRRFEDLQGLRSSSLGAALIVCTVAFYMLPVDFRDPFQRITLPAQLMFLFVSSSLDAYYRQCFGRVNGSAGSPRGWLDRLWSSPSAVGPLVILIGLGVDMFKGFGYPGGVSFGAVALASYSTVVLLRDGFHRLHYLIGAAGGACAIVISSAVPVVMRTDGLRVDPGVASHFAMAYAVIGLSLFAIGLLDHRLLADALSNSGDERRILVPAAFARLRTVIAVTILASICAYVVAVGWPPNAASIYMTLYFAVLGLMIIGSIVQAPSRVVAQSRAYSELTRRREARLLAQVAAMRGATPAPRVEEPTETPRIGPPDLVGHVVLPLAIACGAVIDVTLSTRGMPSILALALAASHLRIALRDRRARVHYLVGVVAASISAVHFMLVGRDRPLDWAVWFLILVSSAMLVEGLLDWRLSRATSETATPGEHHADAL